MKRFLPLMILMTIIFMAEFASGQEKDEMRSNEFKLVYGFAPASELATAWFELFSVDIPHKIEQDSVTDANFSNFGVVSFQYQRCFSKVVYFGGVFAFNPELSKFTFVNGDRQTNSWAVFTLMPRIDFHYLNRKIFSLYSGVGVGISYFFLKSNYSNAPTDSFNTLWYAYQVNLVGIRVGKDISGFAEFGFGYQGFINLGLSARF